MLEVKRCFEECRYAREVENRVPVKAAYCAEGTVVEIYGGSDGRVHLTSKDICRTCGYFHSRGRPASCEHVSPLEEFVNGPRPYSPNK